ncbi:MAG: hypothetical protein ACI4WW_07060 [Candidatus Coprovivens sp.]
MNKIKKIIPILNIIISLLLLLIIIIFNKGSERLYYVIFMTGIVGWILPLFTIFTTGLIELRKVKHKLALILNIISILLNIFILYFIIRLLNKELIIMLISYSITMLITLINIVYLLIYIKENKDPDIELENKKIKKIKKENNGVIK